jgi:hypothetical protein
VAKLHAVDAYRRGEFSANAEHPMLMKLAVWASLSAADAWNARAPSSLALAPEAALRLPNALAGTATVAAIYGLAAVFYGPVVAAAAALIVGLDPNVIALNRLGKEDTFLMLFFMLAVCCYEQAKRVGAIELAWAQPWYNRAGISFGLMFASKYMPYFFGANLLHNLIIQRGGINVPRKVPYNGRIIASFIVANFAILLPSTWAYIFSWLRGEQSLHHGYLYNGQLYANSADTVVFGVPVTYYFHLFATKVPIPVLAGALVGLGLLVTRRRERGFVWLRVLLVMTWLPYSLIGAKFERYALPMMLAVDILASVGLVAAGAWVWGRPWPRGARLAACVAGLALVAVPIAAAPLRAAPFYSVYENAIGARFAPPAVAFPEEAYDFGVREAVRAIAGVAQPDAVIVSDASMVVEHYLARSGRTDLRARRLSQQGLSARGEQWVLVQDSHRSFENRSIVSQLRRSAAPWREYRLAGTTVLEVLRLAR